MIRSIDKWPKLFRRPITWIIIVSVLLRIAASFYLGNQVEDLPGTADQISYHSLALRITGGYGFTFDRTWWPLTAAGTPTAHWSYLYTLFLVAIYTLFGSNPLVARLVQAILVGILMPLLTYKIGYAIFNERVGRIAAGAVAIYTYFIYYSATLMTEPFYITCILISFFLAIHLVDRPVDQSGPQDQRQNIILLILLGLSLGCAVLLRQLFLLFIPFLLAWIWLKRYGPRFNRQGFQLIIPLAVIALMILPITLFNYARFGHFVLLNTNAGYAFFWGNHPVYGTRFVGILTPEMGTYESLIPPELRDLNEAALDSALLRRGLQFIADDPVRYLLLSISRIPVYFQFWPSTESGMVSNLSRVTSFGLFLPLMLYGLIRLLLDGYTRRWSDPVWLLLLFALVYTGIHLLSWTLIRYRLPVDAVLLIFAGYAIYDLTQRISIRRHSLKLSSQ